MVGSWRRIHSMMALGGSLVEVQESVVAGGGVRSPLDRTENGRLAAGPVASLPSPGDVGRIFACAGRHSSATRGTRVRALTRPVPSLDGHAERKSREDVDPRRGVVVSAVHGPPGAARAPSTDFRRRRRPPCCPSPRVRRAVPTSNASRHHLFVVSAKRAVESRGRLRPGNAVQGVERARDRRRPGSRG